MSRDMLFPVVGCTSNWSVGPLAWFFTYGDAASFISSEYDRGYLYIGDPKYDRRESGYRFVEPEQIVEVEHLEPRDGWNRRAA